MTHTLLRTTSRIDPMTPKLTMPFPVPKRKEIREAVNPEYWRRSKSRVSGKEYQDVIEKFLTSCSTLTPHYPQD